MRKKLCVGLLTLLVLVTIAMAAMSENLPTYPETTLTFEDLSILGDDPYTLGTIFNRYNVFVKGDYTGSHVVGPVVAGGDITLNGFGGMSTTTEPYPHPAPSYLKGDIQIGGNTLLTGSVTVPLFIGSINKDKTFYTQFSAPIYVTDKFIDFSKWESFYAQTCELNTSTITIPAADIQAVIDAGWSTAITKGDPELVQYPYYIMLESSSGVQINIKGGYRYSIADLSKVSILHVKEDTKNGNADTIIYSDAKSVTLPQTAFSSGITAASNEKVDAGVGVVFALPEATSVSAIAPIGHIAAPNAHVTISGGSFNGCVVANSLDATGSEGHMWPYNGEHLPMLTNDEFEIPNSVPTPTPIPEDSKNTPTPKPTVTPTTKPTPTPSPEAPTPSPSTPATSPDAPTPSPRASVTPTDSTVPIDPNNPSDVDDPTAPTDTTAQDINNLPKTGDDSNLALFAALLTISLALLGLMASRRRGES